MPKKHTGLTIEQHKELGIKIKQLKELKSEILNIVQHAYGKSSRAGVATRSIVRVDILAREMDNYLARETTKEEWDVNCCGGFYF